MGSLVSVPKISTTPTKNYSAPTYSYTTPTSKSSGAGTTSSGGTSTTTNTSTSNGTDSAASTTSSATSQADRESNLLRRGRGVAGTIRTGFRGLLGIADDVKTARKTLLGE